MFALLALLRDGDKLEVGDNADVAGEAHKLPELRDSKGISELTTKKLILPYKISCI